ncbi:MAG: VWA domain-containing protein [Pirellulaceae bacterium]
MIARRHHIQPMIGRIQPGGGTNMYPAMEQAFVELINVDAAVKHMIVLTDGRTTSANFDRLVSRMRADGVTVTSVAIGSDADLNLMRQIAKTGGGKLFHVRSPRAIPQIVMRETRRVSRPLIYENHDGVKPLLDGDHALLSGVDTPPPIHGYVMTSLKESPLAQSLLVAPGPQSQMHPLLAVWQYGLGRTAVITTDGGQRWASDWSTWKSKPKLYSQLIRWLMPCGRRGKA